MAPLGEGMETREPSVGEGLRTHHSSAPTVSLRCLLLLWGKSALSPSSIQQEPEISTGHCRGEVIGPNEEIGMRYTTGNKWRSEGSGQGFWLQLQSCRFRKSVWWFGKSLGCGFFQLHMTLHETLEVIAEIT